MHRYLILLGLLCVQLNFAQVHDYSGIYQGEFSYGNFQTDLEFDIQLTDQEYQVKFNSLSQNAFGIPAGDINIADNSLNFALQSDFYRYDFKCKHLDSSTLDVILTVDQKQFPFQLNKLSNSRSDTFRSKDVRFRSEGSLLYGTIYYPTKPNGKGIYLVTSSGNQDRSASRAEALMFSRAGYISFHIDKRGTGNSDGNWHLASIPDLCEDDLHALEFFHQSEKLDYASIGIKGSSQGGTKVPYILKKQPKIAFGIVVSCPASTLLESDLNYWKNNNIERIGAADIDQAAQLQRYVFQYIASDLSKEKLEDYIAQNKGTSYFDQVWIPELDQVEFDLKLNYSPLPYFKGLTSPLLIIEGSEDEVIPASSLKTIKRTLGKTANKKNKYLLLKGANHSMMYVGKSDFPYWSSLHKKYMPSMLKWMAKQ